MRRLSLLLVTLRDVFSAFVCSMPTVCTAPPPRFFQCALVCLGDCGARRCQISDDGLACNIFGPSCVGTEKCVSSIHSSSTAAKRFHMHTKQTGAQIYLAPNLDKDTIRKDVNELLDKMEATKP
jgi:hypothetical protein